MEFIGEGEGYDGETRVVVCACVAGVELLLALFVLEVALFAVNVADATVPALYHHVNNLSLYYRNIWYRTVCSSALLSSRALANMFSIMARYPENPRWIKL